MASTNIQSFPGKVGVSNTNPIHTLDIGSNVYIDDAADTKVRVMGNIHASGITVDGNITVIETDNLSVKDPVLLLASGSTGTSDTGIIMKRADGDANVAVFYDEGVGLKICHTMSSGDEIHLTADTANALATSVYGPVTIENTGVQSLSVSGGAQINKTLQIGTIANLYVDTTTSNVGIGTNAPAYKLDVHGESNVGVLTASTIYGEIAGSNAITASTGTFSGDFEVGTANLFVDTTTGNVGIGTTNPTSNLHVVGDVDVTSNILMSGEVFIKTNDGNGKVGIGLNAGQTSQGTSAVAVGNSAGVTSQGSAAVAVGRYAGNDNQSGGGVAVGQQAGQTSQGINAMAIGYLAGNNTQGTLSIAMGVEAGKTSQGTYCTALGHIAGRTSQGGSAVAVGRAAGDNNQGVSAVAVGHAAGETAQSDYATAVGVSAGQTSQGSYATAVGRQSGMTSQSDFAVAIGNRSGEDTQGTAATAVGYLAGRYNQGARGVAVGAAAG